MDYKAAISFSYSVDDAGRYRHDGKMIRIEKGSNIPEGIVFRLFRNNPEYIQDIDDLKVYREIEAAERSSRVSVSEPKSEVKDPVVEKDEPGIEKFSEKALYDMLKAQQVTLLDAFGLSGTEINALRLEKDRVEKLLELQDGR